MTPRWNQNWASRRATRYIGGYGRFDLWVLWSQRDDELSYPLRYRDLSLRVVWGDGIVPWTEYDVVDGVLERAAQYQSSGQPYGDTLNALFAYAKAFCPELAPFIRDEEDAL